MAERTVSVEFVFDRAGDKGLAQAYRMLVPERRARAMQRKDGDDNSQGATVDRGTSRLEPATGASQQEERSALGA